MRGDAAHDPRREQVAALIRSSYLAFRVTKYGGSGYLIYLGVKALTTREHALIGTLYGATGSRTIIGQSIVASLSNPKTILFFLSFLPQFLNTAAPSAAPQLLLLGGIYHAAHDSPPRSGWYSAGGSAG